jgi:hypothetical protein
MTLRRTFDGDDKDLFEALWCPLCGCEDWVDRGARGVFCDRCNVYVKNVYEEKRNTVVWLTVEGREWIDDRDEREKMMEEYPTYPLTPGATVRVDVSKKGDGIERAVTFENVAEWHPRTGDRHTERVKAWMRRYNREQAKREARREERKQLLGEGDADEAKTNISNESTEEA